MGFKTFPILVFNHMTLFAWYIPGKAVPLEAKVGCQVPGARVTGDLELLHGYWGSDLRPLPERCA